MPQTAEEKRLTQRTYDRRCYAVNGERVRAKNRLYYAAHVEKMRAAKTAYNTQHRKEQREYAAAWRAANPEEMRLRNKAYCATHQKELLAYRAAHLERDRARDAAYRKTDIGKKNSRERNKRHHHLKHQLSIIAQGRVLTRQQWENIVALASGRCFWRISPNCPNRHGKRMTAPTQDHIIPLGKGGLHTAENIVAACRYCNSKKQAKIITLF